jgi:hypothetical protein
VSAGVAAPRQVPVLTTAWQCADDAVADELVAVGAPFRRPHHPRASTLTTSLELYRLRREAKYGS